MKNIIKLIARALLVTLIRLIGFPFRLVWTLIMMYVSLIYALRLRESIKEWETYIWVSYLAGIRSDMEFVKHGYQAGKEMLEKEDQKLKKEFCTYDEWVILNRLSKES